jgi:low affinity Fe/Cu permease
MESDERSTPVTRGISQAAGFLGSFPMILLALCLVIAWLVGGLFVTDGFRNNLYQLLVTAGTNLVIFMMVFIIQNSQNREGRAVQTKLDAQAHALRAILDHLEVDHDGPLSRLSGLEEAPEHKIKKEQKQVRDVPPGSRRPSSEEV